MKHKKKQDNEKECNELIEYLIINSVEPNKRLPNITLLMFMFITGELVKEGKIKLEDINITNLEIKSRDPNIVSEFENLY